MYDITNKKTFDSISEWIKNIYEKKDEDTYNALNSTCEVDDNHHNPDNFQLDCYPESFHINGTKKYILFFLSGFFTWYNYLRYICGVACCNNSCFYV